MNISKSILYEVVAGLMQMLDRQVFTTMQHCSTSLGVLRLDNLQLH